MLLVELECPLLEVDSLNLDEVFKSDLFIFASKHRSESGKPCLTFHAPGNWGSEHKFGGSPRELQFTASRALNAAQESLQGKTLRAFREATHHGPTSLKTPLIFMELGSTEKEWGVREYGDAVAESIAQACARYSSSPKVKAALGFGGTHYCTGFEGLQEFTLSHVASKHLLDSVDGEMVRQAVAKTAEPVEKAFLDWKGCNKEQRGKLIAILENAGLPWEKA